MKQHVNKHRHSLLTSISLAALLFGLLSTAALAGDLMQKVPSLEVSDFELLSANSDGDIKLSDYKGKFVLLNFWATWCPPCIKEMPSLNSLHNKLKSNSFEVVGVHVGPALATVKQFLKNNSVDFDIVIDKSMSLSSWPVAGLPTTFLISPSGKIIYKVTGERAWDSDDMVKFLKGVMKEHERLALRKADTAVSQS